MSFFINTGLVIIARGLSRWFTNYMFSINQYRWQRAMIRYLSQWLSAWSCRYYLLGKTACLLSVTR